MDFRTVEALLTCRLVSTGLMDFGLVLEPRVCLPVCAVLCVAL